MLTRTLAACLVVLVVSPLVADTTVLHVANQSSGWRGAYNNSTPNNYLWMDRLAHGQRRRRHRRVRPAYHPNRHQ